MSSEFGPYTPQVQEFLRRLEEWSDQEWDAVVAISPACNAAFGSHDFGEVESILRMVGLFEAGENAMSSTLRGSHAHFRASSATDASSRPSIAATAALALVGGAHIRDPWFRAMYAPFARVIELATLPANDYPTVPTPPESPEERFICRIQALTERQWDTVGYVSDYAITAVGEERAVEVRKRAIDAVQRRIQLDPAAAQAFDRAWNRLEDFSEASGAYSGSREIWSLIAKRLNHDRTWADQRYVGHYASKDETAGQTARNALLAIAGILFLPDSDFALLYLPFCAVIRYGSLSPK